jgi:hypothetical protein
VSCGFLGGSSSTSSFRFAGGSSTGTLGIPAHRNLDQSWKHYCSISSSSSSEVSSMVTALSCSSTTRCSLVFGFAAP